MIKEITLKLLPAEASNDTLVKNALAAAAGIQLEAGLISGYHILRTPDLRLKTMFIS